VDTAGVVHAQNACTTPWKTQRQIAFSTATTGRISWPHFWPHARSSTTYDQIHDVQNV